MTADTIVDLFFAAIFVICAPFVIAAVRAYIRAGQPVPRYRHRLGWTREAARWAHARVAALATRWDQRAETITVRTVAGRRLVGVA